MKHLNYLRKYFYDYHTYQDKIAWDKSVRVRGNDYHDRNDFKRTFFVYKDLSIKRHSKDFGHPRAWKTKPGHIERVQFISNKMLLEASKRKDGHLEPWWNEEIFAIAFGNKEGTTFEASNCMGSYSFCLGRGTTPKTRHLKRKRIRRNRYHKV